MEVANPIRGGLVRGAADNSALCVAVVGCGRFGRNWLRVLEASGEISRILAVDPDQRALEWVGVNHPGAICVPSVESMGQPVDAAIVAAPSKLHGEISSALIRRGVHLLVEKPFANNTLEAQKLIEESIQHDTTLMVGHQLLVHPFYEKLLELTHAGRIGRPETIEAVRCGPLELGADRDVLDAFAPHDLALICAFAGENPLAVTAEVESNLAESIESAAIGLVFPSGLRATVRVGVQPVRDRSFEVRGSKGTICFEDDHHMPSLTLKSESGDFRATGPLDPCEEPLWLEAQQFLRTIRSRVAPRVGAQLGLVVTQILDRVRRGAGRVQHRDNRSAAAAISF